MVLNGIKSKVRIRKLVESKSLKFVQLLVSNAENKGSGQQRNGNT